MYHILPYVPHTYGLKCTHYNKGTPLGRRRPILLNFAWLFRQLPYSHMASNQKRPTSTETDTSMLADGVFDASNSRSNRTTYYNYQMNATHSHKRRPTNEQMGGGGRSGCPGWACATTHTHVRALAKCNCVTFALALAINSESIGPSVIRLLLDSKYQSIYNNKMLVYNCNGGQGTTFSWLVTFRCTQQTSNSGKCMK